MSDAVTAAAEALKPFAELAARVDDTWWDHGGDAIVPVRLKKGDLDRAHDAYRRLTTEPKE